MMQRLKFPENSVTHLLRIACGLMFFGRAWQFIFWDNPLRALFWDENLLSGIVEQWFHMSWYDYATHPLSDHIIQRAGQCLGVFFLLCCLSSFIVQKQTKFYQYVLFIGSAIMMCLSFLYCKEKFFRVGEFIEYGVQFGVPMALLLSLHMQPTNRQLHVLMNMLISMTFIGHGLYAIGFYPVPGHFIDMTAELLRTSDQNSIAFLKIIGFVDLAIGFFIWTNIGRTVSLGYATIWGLGTAMARVLTNVQMESFLQDLSQWLPETIYRLPHGLVPLTALVLLTQWQQQKPSDQTDILDQPLPAPRLDQHQV